MDFWELTKLVFRRWLVAVPLLLLTGAGLTWIFINVAPDYRATAHVQLIPPQVQPELTPDDEHRNNPWAQLGPEALGQAVVLGMQRPSLARSLEAGGLTENFSVTLDPFFPIVVVEAVGESPEQAAETAQRLSDMVIGEIEDQQSQYDVPPEKAITTLALDDGTELTPESGSKRRVAVAVAMLGMLLTAGACVVFDAIAYRRARLRHGRPGAAPWPAAYAPTPISPAAPAAAGQAMVGLVMNAGIRQPLPFAQPVGRPVAGRFRGLAADRQTETIYAPPYPGSWPNGHKDAAEATEQTASDDARAAATSPAGSTAGSGGGGSRATGPATGSASVPAAPPIADDSTVILPLPRQMWEAEETDGRQS
jgi:capsular polysaccharide biosynthesis protein